MPRFLPTPIVALTLLALAAATPAAEPAAPADLASELVGTWSWTLPNGCTETQTYRADGSRSVVSGEERAEGTFQVEPSTEDPNFRRLTLNTARDAGGKDCSGSTSDDTGKSSVIFYLIAKDHQQLMYCFEPELKRCVGPFRRVAGI